ncbi:thiol-disulfide isomerase-like thioredoxin [Aequorivita sublithincola DSM 14238]|uniref:Thiol-disulfide isomerase-like thioredoxin n=1 Tax=Aequorivita sublithincola (strain DSM 14238 / LMG 21431 / ACAM 643 / 9-3) TaxID=746697 RepID=I3YZN3_AEQSU|nr:TlpA disulfide reductase family protein [Aequorivita sublithincola]AFL82451.1 thiol-disulfide isomerase-like thioredoxin [Aequorivita sublithincola DSM 14238]
MDRKLLYLFLLLTFTAQSQIEQGSLFSEVIGKNIKKFTQNSQKAYEVHDFERADFLFDSLINNVINGSYLDNFKVRKLSGRKIDLYKFDKPIFLMTYASWCTPGAGEVPALNDIAKKYYKDIDFVVLFWDSKEKVRRSARKYSSKIRIIYVDEKENKNDHIVEIMKHSLGFPTSFFIDENKRIVDVRRGVLHPYNEKYEISFELNYNSFLNGISLLKNLGNESKDHIASKQNR